MKNRSKGTGLPRVIKNPKHDSFRRPQPLSEDRAIYKPITQEHHNRKPQIPDHQQQCPTCGCHHPAGQACECEHDHHSK